MKINLEAAHTQLRNAILGVRTLTEIVEPERKAAPPEDKAPANAHKVLCEALGYDAVTPAEAAHARLAKALRAPR